MEPISYKEQTHWERRLDEWKCKVMEQQHFHEDISTYLKKVYDKSWRKHDDFLALED